MGTHTATIPALFERIARERAASTAVHVLKGGRMENIPYGSLHERVLRTAAWLQGEGWGRGARGAIVLENSLDWVVVYLGMSYAGMTCVPLDIQSDPRDIAVCIRDSEAAVVFTSESVRESACAGSRARIVVVGEQWRNAAAGSGAFQQPAIDPDDIASIIYTSGSTDRPKGVMLSHANVCANFVSMRDLGICRAGDNILALLPLHHTYPFMVTMILPLCAGARLTFPPPGFKPQELSAVIKAAKVTLIVGVPQLFALLHAAVAARARGIPRVVFAAAGPLIRRKIRAGFGPSVRLCVSGGARLDPAIARELTRWGLPVIEGYGLTEAAPVVAFNPPRRVRFGTVGVALPGVEIRIAGAGPGAEGEVMVRGGNVMKGYFRDEELSAKTIRDGWLHTGDLGSLDRRGYLTITGRLKEVIVLPSGKNIYPEELDAHYAQSPFIKEICVIGVPRSSGGEGEALFAVIRPAFDHFKAVNEANIAGKIRWELENLGKPLPGYKHIMGFSLVKDELPRTTLRKVKRYEVRQQYLRTQTTGEARDAVLTDEDKTLLASAQARRIVEYISRRLKKTVVPDSNLELDLGVDSLSRVELGIGLEEELGMSIPDEVIYSVSTVRDVIVRIAQLRTGGAGRGTPANWRDIIAVHPPQELAARIAARPGIGDRVAAACAKAVCLLLVRLPWFVRVRRAEAFPAGALLICPNHASYLDGVFIFSTLPFGRVVNTFFIGHARVFDHPLLRWVIRPGRVLPIDPSVDLVSALQATAFALERGKAVCIFPEGQRSIDGQVGEFKKGAGILVKELDIPVMPVYIKGSHRSWPRAATLPRLCAVHVRYGRSMRRAQLLPRGTPDEQAYEAIARRIRDEVVRLSETP